MKDEKLMRRISEALDAGGLDADLELRAALADDPDGSAYAEDLELIGVVLGEMGQRAEPDWDALFSGIEARLDGDETLEDIGDPALPPVFADLDATAEDVLEPQVAAPPAQPQVAPGSAKVIDLAARRRRTVFASIGGLAAAAAVGLGIMAGLTNSPVAFSPTGGAEMEAPAAPALEEQTAVGQAAPAAMMPAEEPSLAQGSEEDVAVPADRAQLRAGSLSDSMGATPGRARRATASTRVVDPWDSRAGGSSGSVGGLGGVAGADAPAPAAASAAAPAPVSTAASGPTRAEVVNALNTVTDRVRECMNGRDAVAHFHVRVDGASGRIVSAAVRPPFRGVEARCMVSAVRSVSMPVSARGPYEVDHVYHPAPAAGGSLRARPAAARRARAREITRAPAAEPDPK